MPRQTGTALILLAAFVLLGFVTVLIQQRTFMSAEDPTPLDRLLGSAHERIEHRGAVRLQGLLRLFGVCGVVAVSGLR